jgi:hypothetical protein
MSDKRTRGAAGEEVDGVILSSGEQPSKKEKSPAKTTTTEPPTKATTLNAEFVILSTCSAYGDHMCTTDVAKISDLNVSWETLQKLDDSTPETREKLGLAAETFDEGKDDWVRTKAWKTLTQAQASQFNKIFAEKCNFDIAIKSHCFSTRGANQSLLIISLNKLNILTILIYL